MEFSNLILLSIGLSIGFLMLSFAIAWFFMVRPLENKHLELKGEHKNLTSQLEQKTQNGNELSEQIQNLQSEKTDLEKQIILREGEIKQFRNKLDSQKVELEEMQKTFKNEFQVLANNILEEKSKKFTRTKQNQY